MTRLYFDIETIPAGENKIPLLERLHTDKVEKDKSLGLNNTPEDFDTYYRRTSLNGAFGQVFCISVIKEKDGVETLKTTFCSDEKAMLNSFWETARDVHLYIGHGIRFFDLRFLMQRSIIHGIPCPNVSLARFRDNPVYDTMDQWMCYDGTISLHELALALNIPSPKDGGIDGAQVYDFYLAKKFDAITDYCMRDVETVKLVFQRIVKYKK